ncbi:MAG: hypothetical protein K9M49_03355 [Candidatus Marinimicrobia bacterium]|nr:hypothetical protein [Candidatus Neomarinimicrobiota bacterium]MCF7904171.1 hypothetical protein [Candidatus Neomarinimicrobiota bacterium]
MRENKIYRNIGIWAGVTAVLLSIPLIAGQMTGEVNWSVFDFVIMGIMIFSTGLIFEILRQRSKIVAYQAAFGVALFTAFLLFWINGAVGLIGNENNPANLLYPVVIAIGVLGAVITRFTPGGMAKTLYLLAGCQFFVPVIALIAWPPSAVSWGGAGVFGVFILNLFFVFLFAISATLFRQADQTESERAE